MHDFLTQTSPSSSRLQTPETTFHHRPPPHVTTKPSTTNRHHLLAPPFSPLSPLSSTFARHRRRQHVYPTRTTRGPCHYHCITSRQPAPHAACLSTTRYTARQPAASSCRRRLHRPRQPAGKREVEDATRFSGRVDPTGPQPGPSLALLRVCTVTDRTVHRPITVHGGRRESGDRRVGMSCNGCRVLRKGCSETCILRSCLQWITSPEAQGNATLFLAKFFGRSDLMSLISAVPESQRPALFQSLLFEACGRTVNPVNGAVGLLWSGNWHVCQAAVETVLSGGTLTAVPGILAAGVLPPNSDESSDTYTTWAQSMPFAYSSSVNQAVGDHVSVAPKTKVGGGGGRDKRGRDTMSFYTGDSETTSSFGRSCGGGGGDNRKKLLNLFV
ncbi:hypothetical protein Tsubulata_034588 [Turnera subulata]|uniref:LOB domain-containing protein n=1 Tax=Turnera subulata TaxID=218843 RepID=A0A9Q0F8V3_9ROSI|nr:hypothetical protein Tsubulata_034588 [Turnera subulata]